MSEKAISFRPLLSVSLKKQNKKCTFEAQRPIRIFYSQLNILLNFSLKRAQCCCIPNFCEIKRPLQAQDLLWKILNKMSASTNMIPL